MDSPPQDGTQRPADSPYSGYTSGLPATTSPKRSPVFSAKRRTGSRGIAGALVKSTKVAKALLVGEGNASSQEVQMKDEVKACSTPKAKASKSLIDHTAVLSDLGISRSQQRLFCMVEKEAIKQQDAARADDSEDEAKKRDLMRKQSRMSEIIMGENRVPVWYTSPYPQEYQRQKTVWICEFCLQYFKDDGQLVRHMERKHVPHPPGDEIYRCDGLSLWEVDGRKQKIYCQNLCLLAKLFLNTKTLYYDVEPFWFYVLTQWDDTGAHMVGYFSKEKKSFLNYNLSCIMTLPQYQRRGYGQAMIELSYLLTQKEGKVGTPEKPLSDLGLMSYRKLWTKTICEFLHENQHTTDICLNDISKATGINTYDLVSTLQSLGMIKTWREQHVLVPKTEVVDAVIAKRKQGKGVRIDPFCLRWTPPLLLQADDAESPTKA
eukprot:m.303545 g.303545  ORF g.303545 m.303545 type:complete len:433 (-) comp15893_c0_seq14:3131-4429(-)